MKTPSGLVIEELTALQARFQRGLPDKVAEIDDTWERLRQEEGSVEDGDTLHCLVHTLAGSGEVFGAQAIGKVARELCELLKPLCHGQMVSGEPKNNQISAHISKLKELAAQWEPSDIPYPLITPLPRADAQSNRLIFLVEDDELLAGELALRLEKEEFQVRSFHRLEDLEQACQNDSCKPAVVIMDMVFAEGGMAGVESIQALSSSLDPSWPVIFISARNDIDARLAAVKAGASRYFHKPLDTEKLIRTLEGIIFEERADPYRILLVDDDETLAEFYAAILSDAGMQVKTLANPFHILKALQDFAPDLLLTDVYMPKCSGLELAQVIRQDDSYALMPIVFLSSEEGLDEQLAALGLGGDDFLVKSLRPRHLVDVVRVRVKRSRLANRTNQALHASIREGQSMQVAIDQHAIVSIADVTGRIVYVNDKFCDISGYTYEELINQNHRILKSGVHDEAFYEQMWDNIAHGKVWTGSVCNRRKNGTLYWLAATIVPFLDEDGLPYKYVSVRTDISNVVEMGENLKVFRQAIDSAVDGMAISDVAGEYVFVNEALASIYGYASTDEMTGRSWRSFFPGEELKLVGQDASPDLCAVGKWAGEVTVQRKNGESLPLWLSHSRLADGRMIHVIRDISEEKAAQVRLQNSELRYSRSQNYANIGTWDWDIQTGDLYWSERIGPLFGYGEAVPETTYENFLAAVHPDDRDLVVNAVNDCVENNVDYNIEHRVVWRDGTVRWLLERGDVIRGEDGTPLHMLGVVQDITEQMQLRESLSQQKMLLELLRNGMSHYVGTHDRKQTFNFLLKGLLLVTGSASGFMAEVLYGEDHKPYLKRNVASNVLWEQLIEHFTQDTLVEQSHEDGVAGLLAAALRSGQTMRANEIVLSAGAGEAGLSQTEFDNVLVVPVFYGEQIVGLYGIASRERAYDKEIIDFLRPFTATYGVLIESVRAARREQVSQHELVGAKEEAEDANRAKSQFLSSMSHELRTPMNAILGYSQLLTMETDPGLTESQCENVVEIITAGKHLLELINEVLDLSRIEAGRIDLSIETVEVCVVVQECLSLISPMAKDRGIAISIENEGLMIELDDIKGTNVLVMADHIRLKQVLLNLLTNAVKYNHEQGKIILAFEHRPDGYERISVKDTGPGIARENMDNLFQAFNRMGAENSKIEGTGIGLVITKNITELMGGRIGVESEAKKGSSFWIELPRGVAQQKKPPANTGQDADVVQEVGSENHTVLYVEDNPANLRLVSQVLGQRGDIHFLSAHEPMLGLDLASKRVPDIILLDINLPGMDGFGVLEQLRKREETKNIPVIAISANAMESDIKKASLAGFDDYLTKPIDLPNLVRTINAYLGKDGVEGV